MASAPTTTAAAASSSVGGGGVGGSGQYSLATHRPRTPGRREVSLGKMNSYCTYKHDLLHRIIFVDG